MQPSCLDRINVAKKPLPPGEAADRLSSLEHAARIADVKDKLITCLEELDRLGLSYSAIYLSHAIAVLDDES